MKEVLKESIKMHYENKDYTEVIRDAILCLMNEIRKKSDLQDDDGVDLINKAFSEKKPFIKINKMQTQTEKNKHRGINDLSKGIVEYFRNPMSHAKQNYSKEVADALLVIIDKVLLEEITQSKSINSIEDWYLEVTSELCPNTNRYAKNLADNIPNNKIYELIVQLYKNKENLKDEKITIINELIKKLNEEEFTEYCSIIETDIFGKSKEEDIVKILNFISEKVWQNFNDLSKVKIEDMVLEDIKKCNVYTTDNSFDYDLVQEHGDIAIGAKHLFNLFDNKKEIVECIYEKLVDSKNNEFEFDFIIENFFEILAQEKKPEYDLLNSINDRLRYRNSPIWFDTFKRKLKALPMDNEWHKMFDGMFGVFTFSDNDDELPF